VQTTGENFPVVMLSAFKALLPENRDLARGRGDRRDSDRSHTVLFGRGRFSAAKPSERPPCGWPSGGRRIVEERGIPTIFAGGLGPDNIAAALGAPALRVAVRGAAHRRGEGHSHYFCRRARPRLHRRGHCRGAAEMDSESRTDRIDGTSNDLDNARNARTCVRPSGTGDFAAAAKVTR
jgi:hypothetical protein